MTKRAAAQLIEDGGWVQKDGPMNGQKVGFGHEQLVKDFSSFRRSDI